MAQFVVGIFVLVIALIVAVYLAAIKYRAAGAAAFLAGVALFIGFFAWGGVKSVPVKTIGVPTSFSSVEQGFYGTGSHETWNPFLSLVLVDETVQTTTFEGNNALTVRIGGQQTAQADVTIQWQVRPSAAGALYSDYANHGNLMQEITNAVVVRELKQVVNQVLGDYNPITDVQTVTGTNTATSQFSQFGPTILNDMRADIGDKINVKTVLLPFIHYDPAVENKLNQIQQSFANLAIATENVQVAREQALQYQKLGDPTMNQLVAQCLKEAETNQNLQCIPGATTNLSITQKR